MKRPDVKLENYETIYRYYEAHDQSRAFARLAHKLFARYFKVDLSVAAGAEQAIIDAVAVGTRLVISPNHITGDDQYVIVAFVERMKALHPLRARAFIPSEPSLFTRPGLAGKALRRCVDGLGAVPTFRLEDLRRQGIEITDEIDQRYRSATVRASEAQVAKLVGGEMMAGFWEGTRNRTDYRMVQPLKKGIAHTAIAAAEKIDVAVLPVGLYYGSEPDDYKRPNVPGKRSPHVHVGVPIPVETTSAVELVDLVHPAMQECLDVVVARAVAAAGVLTPA